MHGEPALGRFELTRRIRGLALRIEHDELGVPVTLEAAHDDFGGLAIAAKRQKTRGARARDLRIEAIRLGQPVPIRTQSVGIVAILGECFRVGAGAQQVALLRVVDLALDELVDERWYVGVAPGRGQRPHLES